MKYENGNADELKEKFWKAFADSPFVLFLEPPSLDMRIANQFALFTLMSNPNAHLPEWLQAHPEAARRILIAAEAKQEIRDKLDQAGITERTIYPGADGIARWLTRYYRPLYGPDPAGEDGAEDSKK